MAGTTQVSITQTGYTSLGATGPYLLTPGKYQIVYAASQPANNAIGHSMNYSVQPVYLPLAEQAWAQATDPSQTSVTVTT